MHLQRKIVYWFAPAVNGFLIDDHLPHMVEAGYPHSGWRWGHRGRAWSSGYIKALIDAVNTLA